MHKTRLGILGMGGVGGFIGAPLADFYAHHEAVEIIFICRGKTLESIQHKGLTLKNSQQEMTVQPYLVSDDVQKIGTLDVLLITTKSYALPAVLREYEAVIKKDTVIIPLQNMVNAQEVIRSVLQSKGKILQGCIYVASNIKAPGYIEHKGGPGKIFIGGAPAKEYAWLMDILSTGGLNISFDEKIEEVLWHKYLFVSPVAAVTTAYHKTFGELLDDKNLLSLLEKMMQEVKSLAEALGIPLHDEDIRKSMDLLRQFPYEAKSSLQLDVEQHLKNEKEFLVDYVVEKSREKGLQAENYEKVSREIEVFS